MAVVATFTAADALDLLEWKHAIFGLYDDVRAAADPREAWRQWRETRDLLYATHPQSPIPEDRRGSFTGCSFYGYDPALRTVAKIEDLPGEPRDLPVSIGGTFAFTRIGVAHFELRGQEHELEVDWNDGYGGGIFIAFTDETSGDSTYGGGRYLVDTVKGSDLGFDRAAKTAVLDFNFAYNPSCSYDGRWACPLAPAANRLSLAVTAGERHDA